MQLKNWQALIYKFNQKYLNNTYRQFSAYSVSFLLASHLCLRYCLLIGGWRHRVPQDRVIGRFGIGIRGQRPRQLRLIAQMRLTIGGSVLSGNSVCIRSFLYCWKQNGPVMLSVIFLFLSSYFDRSMKGIHNKSRCRHWTFMWWIIF